MRRNQSSKEWRNGISGETVACTKPKVWDRARGSRSWKASARGEREGAVALQELEGGRPRPVPALVTCRGLWIRFQVRGKLLKQGF